MLEENPDLFRGRYVPKWTWLTMNSPIPKTGIAGEIRRDALWVTLDIDTGDRQRNLVLLGELQLHREVIEQEAGKLDFEEGNKLRCKVIRRESWEGQLLTQADRHDEARTWFYEKMHGLRRGLEAVTTLISPSFLSNEATSAPSPDESVQNEAKAPRPDEPTGAGTRT